MNSNKLLDAYKLHHAVESDYSLAVRLHVTRSTVHFWRRRGVPERLAFQFAIELKLDPASVLAAVRADHAQDPAIKKTWEKVARTMASRAALFLLALMVTTFFGGFDSARASFFESTSNIHYTKRLRLICLFFVQLYEIPKNLTLKIKAFLAFFLHRPQQLKLF